MAHSLCFVLLQEAGGHREAERIKAVKLRQKWLRGGGDDLQLCTRPVQSGGQ